MKHDNSFLFDSKNYNLHISARTRRFGLIFFCFLNLFWCRYTGSYIIFLSVSLLFRADKIKNSVAVLTFCL